MAESKSYPWMTGFCGTGMHEGTKPRSPSGKPMKTCPRVFHLAKIAYNDKGKPIGREDAVCACDCHVMLDKMFEMTGMERIAQDNPEYVPAKSDYWMPSLEDRVASSIASAAVPTRLVESPAPDIVPATVVRSFAPTASGRSARGELESYVKRVCDIWLVEKDVPVCSPAYIAREVARLMAVTKEPSQGAVNSVLERWVALGFAVTAKKPTRFVSYTEDGVRLGLEAMKLRARDRRASQSAARDRGVR